MNSKSIKKMASIGAAGVVAFLIGTAPAEAVVVDVDHPRVTDQGIDFGDGSFVAGAPVGGGDLEWDVTNNIVTPHLTGTLHMKNMAGISGRIRLRFYTSGGSLLNTSFGGSVTPADNSHREWTVNLQPYSNTSIYEVEVCTQTQSAGGVWQTVGCDTKAIY